MKPVRPSQNGETGSTVTTGRRRFNEIDGLRSIAVLSVVAFHFYYRFGPPLLQPGIYKFETVTFFAHGSFGVELFFVISGFVIFGSLEQCKGIREFLLRRYFRLLPAMVLCALVTYFFVFAHGSQSLIFHRGTLLNFLFSFTFIHPDIWNFVLNRDDVVFIDGAYWSLWTEVIFYVAAALVYFSFSSMKFETKWLLVVMTLQVVRALSSPRLAEVAPSIVPGWFSHVYSVILFLQLSYWIYFTVGIFLYSLYKRRQPHMLEWVAAAILVILQIYFIKEPTVRYLFLAVLILFSIVVYRPSWVSFLKWRPVVTVGLISYPLYLIHAHVGLLMANDLSNVIPVPRMQILIPLVVLFILIFFSYFVFIIYERPAIRYLRLLFLRSGKRGGSES